MKKKSLTIVSAICALSLLIFACRKQLDSIVHANESQVASGVLESAKIFNAKAVSGLTLQTNVKMTLKPIWEKSWTINVNSTTKLIVAPTIENYVTNNEVTISRVFVFQAVKDNIVKGDIVEFIGQNYDVKPQLNNLIKGLQSNSVVADFSGAIIHYDLNYYRTSGVLYRSGAKVHEAVMITKDAGGKEIYLMQLSDTGFGTRTFLYREDPKRKILEESASNGGELSNVTIYAGSGGSSYGGAPLIIPELPQISAGDWSPPTVSTSGILNDCVRAITNQLINKNVRGRTAAIIAYIYGGTDKPDIEFTDQETVTSGNSAETVRVERKEGDQTKIVKIVIRLNATVMAQASEEYIADAVIHEAIHAYLTEKGMLMGTGIQHFEMAAKYVDMFSDTLVDMFPGLSKDDAYALAWGGLEAEHQKMVDGTSGYYGQIPYFPQSQMQVRNGYFTGTVGRRCPNHN